VSEAWNRRILFFAGAWNIVAGASALADPARHFAQLYHGSLALGDPLQAFFFRATWINVIAWGVGYIVAGFRPTARGPILLAGALGKLAYFGACVGLHASGGATATLLGFSALDVVFAALFFSFLAARRGVKGQPRGA